MALDGFVKIDGIEGESTDDKHVGWIEIIRYGIGIKQTISTAASSAGGVYYLAIITLRLPRILKRQSKVKIRNNH